jgi:glutathione S-transferase
VEGHSFLPLVDRILFEIFLSPLWGGTIDEAVVEINIGMLNEVLDIYEERLSKRKYLVGDFFSSTNLPHLPWTQYHNLKKDDMISSRKHVNAWWEDISSRPASKKVAKNMRK